MTTGLFIRTFDGDLEWLRQCLRSVRHNCVGWDRILVVGDHTGVRCGELAREMGFEFEMDPELLEMTNGYVAQQASKMRADKFLDTEVISYIDSDCVVLEAFSPDMLLTDGQVTYLATPWSECPDAERAWRGRMREALGRDPEFEFMRRQPMTFLASTVRGAREWLESEKGMGLVEFLSEQMSFSEFNFMGGWAYEHAKDDYYWVDTTKEDWANIPVCQFWSHSKEQMEKARKMVEEMCE